MAEEKKASIFEILKSYIGFKGTRHQGEMGVEVETETTRKYEYPELKYWTCVKDNSLRDFGVEYVLKAPMSREEMEEALAEFQLADKKYKFNKNSVSTSVHVHINFLNESFLTMANFLTAYALVENILIRYSGPDRLSNLFCLPFCDAEGGVDWICKMLQAIARNNYKGASLPVDQVKYGALNAAPLTKLGTLEVRSFRGETDINVIGSWLSILMTLKEFAKRDGLTPIKILNMYRDKKDKILEEIFGEWAKVLRDKDTPKLINKDSVYYASRFASSTRNWSAFGVIKVKAVYKEKLRDQLEDLSQRFWGKTFDELDFAHRNIILEGYMRENPSVRIVEATGDV